MAGNTGTFRALGQTEQPLHGRPALLLFGFAPAEQAQLRQMRDAAGLAVVPLIVITSTTAEQPLDAIAAMPDGTGAGAAAADPRAVIMSGLSERALHALMTGYRSSGLPHALWAVVTPTTASWAARRLIHELGRERQALRDAALRKPAVETTDFTDRTDGEQDTSPAA